jgi:membrane protein
VIGLARRLILHVGVRRFFKSAWPILKQTFSEWNTDNAPRLGAALSYYTVFALAPVLILVIAVAGAFLGRDAAQGKIVAQLSGLMGAESAKFVQEAIAKSSRSSNGLMASIIGLITLMVGASGVMIELQDALNTVWKVLPKPGSGMSGVKRLLRVRLLSLALVVSLGFMLLVSLVMSAALEGLVHWMRGFVGQWVTLGYVINYGVSIGVIALFFALLFKVLPDAKVHWKDVWIGSLLTSVLFHAGKYAIALYIGRASVASSFGAAGSLAVLLVWIYYSAQIVLLGAEFTRAYANRVGGKVVPADNAIEAPHAAPDRLAAEKAIKLGQDPAGLHT